jgi:acyl-CoA synthetase (AMP-forming)/AMP-acid ligase II
MADARSANQLGGWTSLWDLVERRVAATPDGVLAIDEHDRSLTFAEYKEAAQRAAAGLQELGVGEGTNVSWQLPTWLESMVLVGALARLGAVQNPMLPIYRERELRFITGQTNAKLLLVPGEWRGTDYAAMARAATETVPGVEVVVVDRDLPSGDPAKLSPPAAGADVPFEPGVRTDGPWRWVFYTSGTTADPKGARHTDKTVGASGHTMATAFEMTPDDRNAMVFPFTHIGGIGWLFAGLIGGFRHVIVEAFAPDTTIPVLERNEVTIAGAGTVFHLAYLNAQRADPGTKLFASTRAFVGGGAAKPPQLHYDVKAELGGVGVVSGYGLTECPILSMATIHDPDDKLATTEGRTAAGVETKVVKLDDTIAAPGEEGEIRVKGPNLFLGYLDGSLDAEAFDSDGFFRTGDLGNVDAEGYVMITGRLKDVIIRKGETISAKEIEDLLFAHPAVADAAVIGLPDPASGERACALIVPEDAAKPPSLDDLAEYLKGEGVMVQKIPEQLEILDVLPRNPAGKVLKHELRKQYAT